MPPSSLALGIAYLAGILTVLSPCILPILPILVGRSFQSHRYGPIALVIGLVGGFAVAGSVLGVASDWLTGLANGLRSVAIGVLLGLGLLAIFPNWSYRVFSYLPFQRWVKEPPRLGLWGEFWLGTQLGLLWTPCAGPVLAGILVLAATSDQMMGAFWLLMVYGIGAALPMLAIAYSGRVFSRRLLKLRAHSAGLQRVGGVVIAATAIAILLGWDVQVQLWLAPLFPRQIL